MRITDRGILRLKAEYTDYQKILGEMRIRSIKGKVMTGLGEGQYYISREGYMRQFNQKLGFDPYPGTLNLKLAEPFADNDDDAVKIEGFRDENRTFGACKCYPLRIKDIKGAIVRPERSSYPSNLVEIIAPVNLRKTLNISVGDEVLVILE